MKAMQKKISALLLAMALFLSACSTGADNWVFEYNGTQLPAGAYIIFLMEGVAELENRELERNQDDPDYETPSLKKLLQVDVDGVSGDQWVRDNAYSLAQKFFWLEGKFEELGLELGADDESNINAMVDSMWSLYSDYYEGNGVGRSSLALYQRYAAKQSMVFDAMYGPEGEYAVSEEELKERFDQDYALADYLFIYKALSDEEGRSAEEINNEAKARIEDYQNRLAMGAVIFEELIFEEDNFLNADNPEAQITMPEVGEYTIMMNRESGLYYGEEFVNGVFASEVGVPNIVETDSYFILINRHDLLADESRFDSQRDTVLYNYKSEEFLELIDQQAVSISPNTNQSALGKYTPSKIKDMD